MAGSTVKDHRQGLPETHQESLPVCPLIKEALMVVVVSSPSSLNPFASQAIALVIVDRSSFGGPQLSFTNDIWVEHTLPLKHSFHEVIASTFKDEATIENMDRIMKRVHLMLNPRIDDFLSILSPFFAKQRREALDIRQEEIETMLPLIERHRSLLRNPPPGKMVPFSYLDSLFNLKIEGRKVAPSHAKLVTLCSKFINGDTATTATAIEWAIARRIENPTIQSRIHGEIAAAVGRKPVDVTNTEKMVYLRRRRR